MKKMIAPSILFFLLFLFFQNGFSQNTQTSDVELTVFKGSTVVDSIYSPALEGNLLGDPATQAIKVYLPPGYDDYPQNSYPVVYLLHGYTQTYNSFYTSYGIFSRLNRLISEKIIDPIIVVTPNAKNNYDGSFYTNSFVSGNWEDYIVQDVIQYIESKYRVLDNPESRGLSGFSMGGYGAAKIGMKYPSIFKSIGIVGGVMDFDELMLNPPFKEVIITAAIINEYRPNDPWDIHVCYAYANAFAPDTTAKPILGRLPFTADSVLTDSIWQKWLLHDPYIMLPTYKDSLLKLNAIQMYIGDRDDLLPINESFHQALVDNGIEHGYEIYKGGHDFTPIRDSLFVFFSENLKGVVPNVRSISEYDLENPDTLVVISDKAGSLYIVPDSVHQAIDSIYKYQVLATDVLAEEEKEILMLDFNFGNYLVYAVSNDNAVSNIPAEFSVIDTISGFLPEKDLSNIPSVEVFPIPTREDITLLIGSQDPYEIIITALNGQQTHLGSFRKSKCLVDLTSFSKGIYFITVRSDAWVRTEKVVKY